MGWPETTGWCGGDAAYPWQPHERVRDRGIGSRGKREEQERGEHGVGALLDPRGSEGGGPASRRSARGHGGMVAAVSPLSPQGRCHFYR